MGIVALDRHRQPTPAMLYGSHSNAMTPGKVRDDIRDRAAYVYVTGQFPTHLRRNYMGILNAITAQFARPVSLDGRSGSIKITSDVVNDLDLENHPMVKEVRAKVDEGYLIQPSRGVAQRRPFGKVLMYRRGRGGAMDQITVTSEGAVKRGWD